MIGREVLISKYRYERCCCRWSDTMKSNNASSSLRVGHVRMSAAKCLLFPEAVVCKKVVAVVVSALQQRDTVLSYTTTFPRCILSMEAMSRFLEAFRNEERPRPMDTLTYPVGPLDTTRVVYNCFVHTIQNPICQCSHPMDLNYPIHIVLILVLIRARVQ